MHRPNAPTEYREQLKDRILKTAMQEFLTNGIKQVKMDDIARKLGISKRTLYEIYGNKEELLFEGIKDGEMNYERHLNEFQSKHVQSVMDILAEYYRLQVKMFQSTSPLFFFELRKDTRITSYLNTIHKERKEKGKLFFQCGVEEGVFRDDVDYDLIVQISETSMQYVMEHQLYRFYSMDHILYNIIFLFMRGFCTEKGLVMLDEKMKSIK